MSAAVAIVHERFTETGGSEWVVEQLRAIWPDAPVYALLLDPDHVPEGLRDRPIGVSKLQRWYRPGVSHLRYLPFMAAAARTLDVERAELVITSHHTFANRVPVPAGAKVLSYVYTPARWMWEPSVRVREERGGWAQRAGFEALAATQRGADRRAAQRADRLLAISTAVADRIRRWWHVDAPVVAPPVDTGFFTPDPSVRREDFFLLAGRLVPYKRPAVAIAAARQAGVRLVVAGEGRSRPALEAVAGDRTEFLGRVGREELRALYRRCRALVFPGHEDFGIVPVEAQACGAPVIGLGRGGLLDTVVPGRTGVLYPEDACLAGVLRGFDPAAFDPAAIRANAERFSIAAFHRAMLAAAQEVLGRPAV